MSTQTDFDRMVQVYAFGDHRLPPMPTALRQIIVQKCQSGVTSPVPFEKMSDKRLCQVLTAVWAKDAANRVFGGACNGQ